MVAKAAAQQINDEATSIVGVFLYMFFTATSIVGVFLLNVFYCCYLHIFPYGA